MMNRAIHWDEIYNSKSPEEVSWFTSHLTTSLDLIESAYLDPETANVIDVGGGRSTLVDDLLIRGYRNLTVLDISASAIEQTKERLRDKAASVN